MSIDIVIQPLGESISEATIAKWHKKVGDVVKIDDLLLELETEKVTLEVNATFSGVITSISKTEGSVVTVGEVVGIIDENKGVNNDGDGALKVKQEVPSNDVPVSDQDNKIEDSKKNNLSDAMPPSVKKLITENNLNPEDIKGTGRDGRINKVDVLSAIDNARASSNTNSSIYNKYVRDDDRPVERVRMSRLRQTIAQRLKDSQNTAAILTTFNEIDMSNVINLRKSYREEFEKRYEVKLGFMSFFTKAVVEALKEVPSVNAEIENNEIIYKRYYDIGVAVGTDQGLVVPVVRNVDKLSFAEIEKTILSLALKARDGKLSMSDLTGGTFSITNGGVYGSLLSTPIINPPQTGIIGLHNTQERPVVIDGKIEIRPMMYVALSYDHRIIDGRDAVMFLVKVKKIIEHPERMLFNI